ncbi:MAG: hypothetical protein COC24_017490 [Alphaproteobacteria bacterium]|nr:hypothetical protein [Alphaproteobacteria bacterium]
MHISAIKYELPKPINATDLPCVLARRRPNYALALGWSGIVPSETGLVDKIAVNSALSEQFTILGRSPLNQLKDTQDAEALYESLGISEAYVSRESTASDMAETCVTGLLRERVEYEDSDIAAIIYCHATPEEKPNLTPSFRIQTATNDDLSLPFSVSGSDSASFISALQVGDTLLKMFGNDKGILIVTADRMLPPIHSRVGDFTFINDAAAAFILRENSEPGGYHILGTQVDPSLAGDFDWNSEFDIAVAEDQLANVAAKLVSDLLNRHDILPKQISGLVSQFISERFSENVVSRIRGLPTKMNRGNPKGNFATSSIPIAMSNCAPSLFKGDLVIGWCLGLDGTIAALLAEKS